jgi:hypothetical protein
LASILDRLRAHSPLIRFFARWVPIVTVVLATVAVACASRSHIARITADTGRCDTGVAARATEGVIDEALIGALLKTGTAACSDNAEFGEVFNEAVFYCLEHQPDAFIRQFPLAADRDYVVGALESPVNDAIDVAGILAIVRHSSLAGTAAQRRVVAALETAIGKG